MLFYPQEMYDDPDPDFRRWTLVSSTHHIAPDFAAGTWPILGMSISLTILFEFPTAVTSRGSESHSLSREKLATRLIHKLRHH
jgi:hypothetical protein